MRPNWCCNRITFSMIAELAPGDQFFSSSILLGTRWLLFRKLRAGVSDYEISSIDAVPALVLD